MVCIMKSSQPPITFAVISSDSGKAFTTDWIWEKEGTKYNTNQWDIQ